MRNGEHAPPRAPRAAAWRAARAYKSERRGAAGAHSCCSLQLLHLHSSTGLVSSAAVVCYPDRSTAPASRHVRRQGRRGGVRARRRSAGHAQTGGARQGGVRAAGGPSRAPGLPRAPQVLVQVRRVRPPHRGHQERARDPRRRRGQGPVQPGGGGRHHPHRGLHGGRPQRLQRRRQQVRPPPLARPPPLSLHESQRMYAMSGGKTTVI